MDSNHSPQVRKDIHDVQVSMQTLSELFAAASNQSPNDTIVKVTQPEDVFSLVNMSTPGEAHPVEEVINEACKIYDYRMRMNHPHIFAFITSPVSPYSWLGESLNSAFNPFSGSKLQGSGPGVVESTLLKWLASRVGFPATSGGIFVSGGSMANLTAMVMARDQKLPRDKVSLGVAYVSDQTHSSIAKALRILGISRQQIRCIPTNDKFQMTAIGLANAIAADREAGLLPFVVIATCGTTNTGSVDPFAELAEVCHRENVWMHVDGSYGASASLSMERTSIVSGLEHADSLSWGAHKWLFQTYGCGFVLVKEKNHLLESFGTDAEYLRDAADEGDVPNFWSHGMELTRPARAMKLWFTLRTLGVKKIGEMIDHGFVLAERAESELQKLPDWTITSPASMGILTFRFVPGGKSASELDCLNSAISKRLVSENVAGMLTTELHGQVVLRTCSIHPLLSKDQMAAVIIDVDRVARSLLLESE